ncbi:hypothetical protein [Vibrio agarivorans]|uniref:hypothetical protein n=1 Tax=Vibrio agarivorans TaxID=153622 RepID=UPI0025B53DB6|nr:hypothetical protein [Vibrio agarivorans]MDN3661170.1 hypothetical protein [Vibrio agarivorans]
MIAKPIYTTGRLIAVGATAIAALSFLLMIAVNLIAIINFDAINNLYTEKSVIDGEISTVGLVDGLNHLMTLLWVDGGITSLLILESFQYGDFSILPLLYLLLVSFLYERSRQSKSRANRTTYSSLLCLLVYMTINVNVAQIGDWRAALTLQPYHVAELVNYSYWESIKHWLDTISGYGIATLAVIAIAIVYTAMKSHVIAKEFSTGKATFGSLLTGCGLAVAAPYRLSQAYDITLNPEIKDKTDDVREHVLTSFKINTHNAQVINQKLERVGLTSLSDHSASYIIEAVKDK